MAALGNALKLLRKTGFDAELHRELTEWGKARNRAMHMAVKVGGNLGMRWDSRLLDAEETARKGVDLENRVRNEVRRLQRRAAREARGAAQQPLTDTSITHFTHWRPST